MSRLGRLRVAAVFAAWSALAMLGGALTQPTLATSQTRSDFAHQQHFRVDSPWGSVRAVATWPRRTDGREFPSDERLPILVALHGRGEAARGPDRGYLGWNVDYRMPDAMGALLRRRLSAQDYQGLVRPAHLRAMNDALRAAPYRGLFVVTPYTPDLLDDPPGSPRIVDFAAWVAGPFLDAVRAQFPATARTREGTGIDGVSLGGMLALETGLRHPDRFGSIGAIQPAIHERELALLAVARTMRARPALQLLTSERDPFLEPTRILSRGLRAMRYPHSLSVLPGPHDYSFNRGPGALEMLFFHDRVLTRERATLPTP